MVPIKIPMNGLPVLVELKLKLKSESLPCKTRLGYNFNSV